MKKIIILLFVAVVVLSLFKINKEEKEISTKEEVRAIYISYIELSKYFDNKTIGEAETVVNDMVTNVSKEGFNWIILQVRSFSDSIYNSDIFPTNYSITRDENIELEFDLLELFISSAHTNNIKVHAWINPFRIRNETTFSNVSISNPAFKYLGTDNIKLIEDKGVFYNPASKEVQSLIIDGIKEIINNYDIDGIHIDDYFYPDKTIDLTNYQEYKKNGGNLSIEDYRLDVINKLIKNIYKTIKEKNKNVLFGIAPDGNINNNYNDHYADIYTWLESNNYIDYIMPQIYYGFKNENKPFTKTINEWNGYIKNKEISLIPALALYKTGVKDNYAGSGNQEWIEYNNIIQNQILVARTMSNYSGFSLFRYGNYFDSSNENTILEIENFRKVIKIN